MRSVLSSTRGPLLASALTLLLAGCAVDHSRSTDHAASAAAGMGAGGMAGKHDMGSMGGMMMGQAMAVATLGPTQGQNVRGIVMFHGGEGHVMVHARISGLAPGSEHGFHVHDKGDCASADGSSAGGHFNPGATAHGAPDAVHHGGDMPNLKADAQGVAEARFVLQGLTVGSGAADLLGRSVIVHAQGDDYHTQPTGNSGARLACGVIARPPH